MLDFLRILCIREIPDSEYLEYQKLCPNGVQETIYNLCKNLLKKISGFNEGDAEVTLRITFEPASEHRSLQSRMNIFFILKAVDSQILEVLIFNFLQGPLSRFYDFISLDGIAFSWDRINNISQITRKENIISPSISNEINYQILSCYYSPQLLEPNNHIDSMDLDKTFDKVGDEVVAVDISLKPIHLHSICSDHAKYLSGLEKINNTWGTTVENRSTIDFFDTNKNWEFCSNEHFLSPLKTRDPIAAEILSDQRRFHEMFYKDHLAFKIRVFTETAKTNALVTSCVADSGFRNGQYQSFLLESSSQEFESVLSGAKHLFCDNTHLSKLSSQENQVTLYNKLACLNQCATIEELSGIFRLPVASLRSPFCIRKNTDPRPVSIETQSIPLGTDMEISDFLIRLTLILICKHLFITGMPGVGKTSTIFNIMIYLWGCKVPFIVFESAKTEYRNLKKLKSLSGEDEDNLAKDLQIYTPGNEGVSPIRINPLKIPENVSRDNHIAILLSLLQGAIPMSGPLPALITEALERVYEKYPDNQHPPILKDLLNTIQEVLNEKSYSPETLQDIMTAIEVRLKSLTSGSIGKVFQCQHNIPDIHELTKTPSIIELEGLSNEQKCFLTLIILTRITEHFKTISQPNSKLKFVIFIEEAHNIIGRTFNASPSPDNPDPKSYITEFICKLLAELRSLGVGVVIIDQLPSAIAPQVIKNTATKLAFRQVDREDREILGSSMLLKEYETENLARLEPGEAYFLTEGMYYPRKIKLFNFHEKYTF